MGVSKVYSFEHKLLNKIARKIYGKRQETKYYKHFFKNSPIFSSSKRGDILIYSGIGSMYISPIEILFYHLLTNQGFEVDYCIYNEKIPVNEVITKERIEEQGKDNFWNASVKHAISILSASKIPFQYITIPNNIDEIVPSKNTKIDHILDFKYDGVDFGSIVKGVMYRYYKSLKFDQSAHKIAYSFLITALTNYLHVKKMCENKSYKYVLFSHGIYCTWEPVVEYCKQHNINYICYDRSKTKGHCNINFNQPSPVWDISRAWERLNTYILSVDELERVDQYLEDRILQKGDVYSYNFSAKEQNIDQLRSRLGVAKNAKVITVFTNLIWDAANVSRDIAFKSPLECIEQIINHYKEKDGIHILIRSHPAEKVLGTKERYGQLVRNTIKDLPFNVTIIEPEDNINSFSVLEVSDIGIVHTSTVGLEMAIEGKPVILISDTHYRSKGFTYDATSQANFFDLLKKLLTNTELMPKQVELAKKYFYLMMFEYQHKMPMAFTSENLFNGYGYESFESIVKDKEASINKIVERIANTESIKDFIFR